MKVQLSVLSLAGLFFAWLAASFCSPCVATDYPGLSVKDVVEQGAEELDSDKPADDEELSQSQPDQASQVAMSSAQ